MMPPMQIEIVGTSPFEVDSIRKSFAQTGRILEENNCRSQHSNILLPRTSIHKNLHSSSNEMTPVLWNLEGEDSLDREISIIVNLDSFSFLVKSELKKKVRESLLKHKGDKMSQASRLRYFNILSYFEGIPVSHGYSAYSIINKFVKTALSVGEHITLNTTYFEERESEKIAFSIEYDEEVMLVGSALAEEVADKFRQLLQRSEENGISC